ncbi:hypothetical protein As57867_025488, partial [Aphanomyces stellatus]
MKLFHSLVALATFALPAAHGASIRQLDSNSPQAAKALSCPPNAPQQRQSPIDLPPLVPPIANKGNFTLAPLAAAGTVTHDDHTVKTVWKGGSTLTLNGRVYTAAQFHHHAPSEHTINGRHFDLELHFVHADPTGKLAVLGVFFDVFPGPPNAFLDQFVPGLGLLKKSHDNFTLPIVSAKGFGFEVSNVYRYAGSLTTHPFTEGVEWSVLTDVQSM